MWAMQTLNRSRSMSSDTRACARWAALRRASAGPPKAEGRGASGAAAASAASCTSRHSRCTKRQAPCAPSSVQITSRSGGESDSMNQRAVSAPAVPEISSRPTVLRFDFDIFSIGPISTGSPPAISVARRRLSARRAGDVLPGRVAVERIAGAVEVDVVGQLYRQVGLRHRHDPAGFAVDHRDRAAPVALARDAPVAQAEIDLAVADR